LKAEQGGTANPQKKLGSLTFVLDKFTREEDKK